MEGEVMPPDVGSELQIELSSSSMSQDEDNADIEKVTIDPTPNSNNSNSPEENKKRPMSSPKATFHSCTICSNKINNYDEALGNLDTELLVFFFLKKFLKYHLISDSKLSKLVSSGNFRNSIKFCKDCGEQVENGMKIYKQIKEFEEQLDVIRSLVEDRILESCWDEHIDKAEEIVIKEMIRKKVRDKSSLITPFHENNKKEECSNNPLNFLKKEHCATDDEFEEELEELDPNETIEDIEEVEEDFEEEDKEELNDPQYFIDSDCSDSEDETIKQFITPKKKKSPKKPKKKKKQSKPKQTTPDTPPRKKTKPFKCLVCGMTFGRKDYLSVHIACHSDYPGMEKSRNPPSPPSFFEKLEELHKTRSAAKRKARYAPVDVSDDDDDSETTRKNKSRDSDYVPPQIKKSPNDPLPRGRPRKYPLGSTRSYRKPMLAKETRTCPKCSVEFPTFQKMTSHLKTEHKEFPRFMCVACSKAFFSTEILIGHKIRDHQARPEDANVENTASIEERTCSECKKIYETLEALATHKEKHTSATSSSPLICHLCAKQFSHINHLNRHLQNHDESSKTLVCPETGCSKTFRRKRDMEVHSRLHSGVKEFLCTICGQNFRHEWSFRRHCILKHEEKPSREWGCQNCGKVFKIKWHLDQHMQSKSHGGAGLKKRVRNRRMPEQSRATNIRRVEDLRTVNYRVSGQSVIIQPQERHVAKHVATNVARQEINEITLFRHHERTDRSSPPSDHHHHYSSQNQRPSNNNNMCWLQQAHQNSLALSNTLNQQERI